MLFEKLTVCTVTFCLIFVAFGVEVIIQIRIHHLSLEVEGWSFPKGQGGVIFKHIPKVIFKHNTLETIFTAKDTILGPSLRSQTKTFGFIISSLKPAMPSLSFTSRRNFGEAENSHGKSSRLMFVYQRSSSYINLVPFSIIQTNIILLPLPFSISNFTRFKLQQVLPTTPPIPDGLMFKKWQSGCHWSMNVSFCAPRFAKNWSTLPETNIAPENGWLED